MEMNVEMRMVEINVEMKIITPPIDQSAFEGYPVNFSCAASGYPAPTFVWTFNDDDLPSGIIQTDQERESTLELPRVINEMKGNYRCTAKNIISTANSSAKLHVYGKFNKKKFVDYREDECGDEDGGDKCGDESNAEKGGK
ncbi:neural cell adhesion molecule L1-like protein [Stylophora pistillata]|uniref:neural cell adhesion molecule L1-like protein n=1 Tax=Stylophora pistillata TaxID=50429 RepID=UPI000C045C63|nr:neural cell adhesion molecule L1-like protein [Stylophora pistillata]